MLEKQGLKSSPSERELVLAIRSISNILKVDILPKNTSERDAIIKWRSLIKKYPKNYRVFKEVLRFINQGKTFTTDQIENLRFNIIVPEGFKTVSDYFNVSANYDSTYTKISSILRVLRTDQKYKNDWVEYCVKAKTGVFYYSEKMLKKAKEIYHRG